MNKQSNEFGGWTNFETWCVGLWIDNNGPSHQRWRAAARQQRAEALDERTGIAKLAVQLKDEFTSSSGDIQPRVYADLVAAVLANVNWREIAEDLANNVERCPFEFRSNSERMSTRPVFVTESHGQDKWTREHVDGDGKANDDVAGDEEDLEYEPDDSDTEDLGDDATGVDLIKHGDVCACWAFEATRFELVVLAQYWHRKTVEIGLSLFQHGTTGDLRWPTADYARCRIRRLRRHAGEDFINEGLADVDAEFRECLGEEEWMRFQASQRNDAKVNR